MNVIPVLDLKGGLVVRGVAGRRNEYRPVESRFATDAQPASVARGLAEHFGFSTAYVADLDAIGGSTPAWETYAAIAAAGLRLVIDAGVRHLTAAAPRSASAVQPFLEGVVIGLESLTEPDQLPLLTAAVGPEQAIFSLDLKAGVPFTEIAAWRNAAPRNIAATAVDCGVRRLIVLDLASVGVRGGPSVGGLCSELAAQHPDLQLIAGGGVRSLLDIQRLVESGCESVLVASALHDGSLTPAELQALR